MKKVSKLNNQKYDNDQITKNKNINQYLNKNKGKPIWYKTKKFQQISSQPELQDLDQLIQINKNDNQLNIPTNIPPEQYVIKYFKLAFSLRQKDKQKEIHKALNDINELRKQGYKTEQIIKKLNLVNITSNGSLRQFETYYKKLKNRHIKSNQISTSMIQKLIKLREYNIKQPNKDRKYQSQLQQNEHKNHENIQYKKYHRGSIERDQILLNKITKQQISGRKEHIIVEPLIKRSKYKHIKKLENQQATQLV